MKKLSVIAALTLAASACGRVADLQPQAGKTLPQKPALAARALTAEELLTLPPHADPERIDELNRRGQVRQADRFDLPPPDGESVPLPVDQSPAPSTTGADNQEPRRR